MELTNTPSFRLDGKRALITGGAGGLGLAAGSVLAQAGAHVTLVDIAAGPVKEAAAAIRARGDSADVLVLNVTDVEAVRAAVAAAEPYDILFNNAGTNRPAMVADVKVEDFDWVFALNVRGTFFLAQAVARRLIETKRSGSIINTSSTMGHVGMVSRVIYCATKHAVEGMTKAMAVELAAHGIRVNTIAPTFVETPLTRPMFQKPEFRDMVLSKIKIGRLGRLEEIAAAVLYLASDASGIMTGSSMLLDGGWTAD
jgi:NAD(P)-dependent dehydrogenase (short-subunit alcohol dehydrogenase family)